MAQLVKSLPTMWETWVQSLGWEDPLGKGKATHFQYSGLENSMDCLVHGVAESQTQLNNFHFTSQSSIKTLKLGFQEPPRWMNRQQCSDRMQDVTDY